MPPTSWFGRGSDDFDCAMFVRTPCPRKGFARWCHMSMVCVPDPYPGALEVLVVEDVPRRRPNVLLHHFHLVLTRKFDGPRESSLACEQLQEPVGRTGSRFSLCRQGDRGCVLFLAGAFAAAFRCLFLALSILVRAQAYLASGGSPLCTRFWASIRGVALCPSIAELSSFLRRMEESTPAAGSCSKCGTSAASFPENEVKCL